MALENIKSMVDSCAGDLSKFTFFVGAGVSVNHPSNVPTWAIVRDNLFDSLAKEADSRKLMQSAFILDSSAIYHSDNLRSELEAAEILKISEMECMSLDVLWDAISNKKVPVWASMDHKSIAINKLIMARNSIKFRPEVLFQILKENITYLPTIHEIFLLLNQGSPNENHKAIAWAVAEHGLRYIVTTNFDTFIENALRDVGLHAAQDFQVLATEEEFSRFAQESRHTMKAYILKIHGTADDFRSLRFALEDTEFPIAPSIIMALTRALRDQIVVFWGYSARDPDICDKILFEIKRSPKTFFGMLETSIIPIEILRGSRQSQNIEIIKHPSSLLVALRALISSEYSGLGFGRSKINAETTIRESGDLFSSWANKLDDVELLACLANLFAVFGKHHYSQYLLQEALTFIKPSVGKSRNTNSINQQLLVRLSIAEGLLSYSEGIDKAIIEYEVCQRMLSGGHHLSRPMMNKLRRGLSKIFATWNCSTDPWKLLYLPIIKADTESYLYALKWAIWHFSLHGDFEEAKICADEAFSILERTTDWEQWLLFAEELFFLKWKIESSIQHRDCSELCAQYNAVRTICDVSIQALISGDFSCYTESDRLAALLFMVGSKLELDEQYAIASHWHNLADKMRNYKGP